MGFFSCETKTNHDQQSAGEFLCNYPSLFESFLDLIYFRGLTEYDYLYILRVHVGKLRSSNAFPKLSRPFHTFTPKFAQQPSFFELPNINIFPPFFMGEIM